ncbi:MAG: DUF2141 domain-containing protein [Sandaracinaceae bacterium]
MRLARVLWSTLSISLAFAALSLAAFAQETSPEEPATAEGSRRLVAVVHTRDDRGRVFCAIWRGREGYPTQRVHAVGQAMDRTIVRHRGVCVFDDVTPGEYALAAFHDENANNDLDRNIFGIPSEGTGASNDAHNMFGPPGYDDARFQYPDVQLHRIAVHIHY